MTASITLRRPDDWHLHLRDGRAARFYGMLDTAAAAKARALVKA